MGLAAGCVLLPSTAAGAATCGPTDAIRVVTASTDQGIESTAIYGHGLYRVSRCARDGRFVEGMTVGRIRDPLGRLVRVPLSYSTPESDASLLYGDPTDPVWVAAWAVDGVRTVAQVWAPTAGADVQDSEPASAGDGSHSRRARAAQGGDSCTNHQFVRYGVTASWALRRYQYRINVGTFGNNDTTRSALISGHHNWDFTNDDCGIADWNNITSDYIGTTTGTASSTANGQSVRDKGEVANLQRCGNSTTAIACAWQFPGQATGPYTETDQRYDDDYSFTNTGATGAYDYQHIATHEVGHTIGLDHAPSSPNLTMFPQAAQNTTRWRTLAIGDVDGMRNIYP